jgi:hypothetical protein
MNPVSDGVAGNSGHKRNRRSLAALLVSAVIAVAALGATTAPASAKPKISCRDARIALSIDMRLLDAAHKDGRQNDISFYRSMVFSDQLAILENC